MTIFTLAPLSSTGSIRERAIGRYSLFAPGRCGRLTVVKIKMRGTPCWVGLLTSPMCSVDRFSMRIVRPGTDRTDRSSFTMVDLFAGETSLNPRSSPILNYMCHCKACLLQIPVASGSIPTAICRPHARSFIVYLICHSLRPLGSVVSVSATSMPPFVCWFVSRFRGMLFLLAHAS
jgi:hypothetical protein